VKIVIKSRLLHLSAVVLLLLWATPSFCGAAEKVLVLDLENKTFDAEREWVGIGVSYLIRQDLSLFKELAVSPDRKMKPNPVDGEFDYVVGGDVRYADGKYTITVEISKGAAGENRESRKQFLTEGEDADIFRIADYFVSRLANYLSLPYDEQDLKLRRKDGTHSVTAFENFIKAIHERRVNEKVTLYQAAIAADNRFATAHLHLALIYIYASRYDAAGKELNRVLELTPDDAEARNNLGYVLAQKGDLEGAARAFEDALRIDPTSVKYYLNLGDVLKERKEYTAAEQVYRKALALQPGDPEIAESLDDLSWRKEHPELVAQLGKPPAGDVEPEGTRAQGEKEEPDAEQAPASSTPKPKEVKPEQKVAQKEKPQTGPKVAQKQEPKTRPQAKKEEKPRKEKKKEAAPKPEKRAPAKVAGSPLEADVLDARATLDTLPEETRRACLPYVEGAEEALRDERSPDALYNLGLFQYTTGMYYAALSYLRDAVNLSPGNPDYHTALGNVYLKLKKKSDAEKEFRLAKARSR
jgi:Flp pilus assembly protein TadD/TolB-like protein